jgi:hypothetical protein
MKKNPDNTEISTALKWGLFSATATICAFILPVFIWHHTQSNFNSAYPAWLISVYIGFIFFCALYHSLYRIKALCEDFCNKGFKLKIISAIISFLLITGILGILIIIIK